MQHRIIRKEKKLRRYFIPALLAGLLVFAASAEATKKPVTKTKERVTYKVKADFDDVREQVQTAIGSKGIKINNISYIGKMLIRTGKDLGFKKQVYTKAQAFEFCSATHSRFTMEADPHNIMFCPYIISVYELADEQGMVYLTYRRPAIIGSKASKKSLRDVEQLMDDIVQEALSWF
jgi:uncharacterized protein (DUF302 family)